MNNNFHSHSHLNSTLPINPKTNPSHHIKFIDKPTVLVLIMTIYFYLLRYILSTFSFLLLYMQYNILHVIFVSFIITKKNVRLSFFFLSNYHVNYRKEKNKALCLILIISKYLSCKFVCFYYRFF